MSRRITNLKPGLILSVLPLLLVILYVWYSPNNPSQQRGISHLKEPDGKTSGPTRENPVKKGTASKRNESPAPAINESQSVLDSDIQLLPDGSGWIETSVVETAGLRKWLRIENIHKWNEESQEYVLNSQKTSVADAVLVKLADEAQIPDLLKSDYFVDARKLTESGWYSVQLKNFKSVDDLPKALRIARTDLNNAVFAEPDYIVSQSDTTPNDRLFRQQWYLNAGRGINAQAGWDITTDASNVIVAVIDSGILATHEDLKGNLWNNPIETEDGFDNDNNGYVDDILGINAIDGTGNPYDESGHGTQVSGLIAATGNNMSGISGVAWKTNLMILRFLNEEGQGSTSDALKCIQYALTHEANIINLSWGGSGKSQALEDMLLECNAADILCVASAGNSNVNIDSNPTYPASYSLPNLITVAATNEFNHRASFSNWGPNTVHIAAPGDRLLSTYFNSESNYLEFTGTSAAAPLVSGVAAMARARFGLEPAEKLRSRLIQSARLEKQLGGVVSSGGVIDLYRVLSEINNAPGNDNFEKATQILSPISRIQGSLELGTLESSEPNPQNLQNAKSLWYSLQFEQPTEIGIRGLSGFPPAINFYSGNSLNSLEFITGHSPTTPTFEARLDTKFNSTVFVQLLGPESGGSFDLELFAYPPNDDFAYASELEGTIFSVSENNRYATQEIEEPSVSDRSIGKSLWWKWNPESSGTFYLTTFGSETDTLLSAFQGNTLANLELLASNDNLSANTFTSAVTFEVVAGSTYYFQVDCGYAPGGEILLSGQFQSGPTFIQSPESVSADVGSRIVFSGVASGPEPLVYRWFKDGKEIPFQTTQTLVIATVSAQDYGSYQLEVSSPGGNILSPKADLLLIEEVPTIVVQPEPLFLNSGETGKLSVLVSGEKAKVYNWYRNFKPLTRTTSNVMDVHGDENGYGLYFVEIGVDEVLLKSNAVWVQPNHSDNEIGTRVSTRGTDQLITTVDYFDGKFIAAGGAGEYKISTDGFTWSSKQFLQNGLNVFHSAVGNGKLILAQDNGTLAVTDDLESWDIIQPISDNYGGLGSWPYDLVFVNEKFFASTYSGSILESTNGLNWTTSLDLGEQSDVRSLSAAAGKILVVEVVDGILRIHRSTNGTNWEFQDYPEFTVTDYSQAVGGVDFFLLSADKRYFSSDGTNWTLLEVRPYPNDVVRIIKVDNRYYAALNTGEIMASGDGLEWSTILDTGSPTALQPDLAHGEGTFVVATINHSTLAVKGFNDMISPDKRSQVEGSDIEYLEGQFIVPSNRSILASKTGASWKKITFEEPNISRIEGIAYGNGIYTVGPGTGPSPDKLTFWDKNNSSQLKPLIFEKGIFVATSNSGIRWAEDGVNWEDVSLENSSSIVDIIYANDKFVGVGYSGTVAYSQDGKIWTKASLIPNSQFQEPNFTSVAYGNGKYVSPVEEHGERLGIYESENGTSWNWVPVEISSLNLDPDYSFRLKDIEFWNDEFYIASGNFLIKSKDLLDWSARKTVYQSEKFVITPKGLYCIGIEGVFRIGAPLESPPYVAFKIPGKVVTESNRTLDFELEVADVSGLPVTVSFFAEGLQVGEASQKPYRFFWTVPNTGTFKIKATATNASGQSSSVSKIIQANRRISIPLQSEQIGVENYNAATLNGSGYLLSQFGVLYRRDASGNWNTAYQFPSGRFISLHRFKNVLTANAENGVYSSPDGINWSFHELPGKSDIVSEERGNVLITGNIPTSDYFSLDGTHWQKISSDFSYEYREIHGAFNSIIIAESSIPGEYLIKRANEAWQSQLLPGGQFLKGAFSIGNTLVFWVRDDDTGKSQLYKTTDLAEWQKVSPPNVSNSFNAFMANGLLTAGSVFTSDLINWNHLPQSVQAIDITRKFGAFYVASKDGILSSVDGQRWTTSLDTSLSSSRFIEIGDYLCLASSSGSWQTLDGQTWEYHPGLNNQSYEDEFRSMTYGHAGYLGLTTNKLARSEDGIHWQFEDKPENMENSIAYGNGVYVSNTDTREMIISGDGIQWEYITLVGGGIYWHPRSIHFLESAGLFLADNENFYFTSEDGRNWTMRNFNPDYSGHFRKSGGMIFGQVRPGNASSGDTTTFATADGLNWHPLPGVGPTNYIYFQNGIFLAGGNHRNTPLMKSENGIDWTIVQAPVSGIGFPQHIDEMGFYVAFGDPYYDRFFFTKDAEEWTELPPFNWVGNVFIENQRFFYSNPTLQLAKDDDIGLSEISTPSGTYAVGDTIEAVLRVANPGGNTANLGGIEVWSVLVEKEGWLGNKNRTLTPVTLSPQTVEPGETISVPVQIKIPNGTEPGTFGLQAWINPTQVFLETTAQNNYAWTGGLVIDIPAVSLSIDSSTGGKVTALPAKNQYGLGDTVSLVAEALPHFRLMSWEGVDFSNAEVATLFLDSDRNASAQFQRTFYPEIDIKGIGKVYIDPEKAFFVPGDQVTVTAIPGQGWTFLGWSHPLAGKGSNASFEINSDIKFQVRFGQLIEDWKHSVFSEQELEQESISGNSADPDLDGFSNEMEFYFGTNPMNAIDQPMIRVSRLNHQLLLGFEINPTATGKRLTVETSTNLSFWESTEFQVEENAYSDSAISITLGIEIEHAFHRFYRLKLEDSE